MRRLLAVLAAVALLAAAPAAAQTIDPGTPTTIAPAPSDGDATPAPDDGATTPAATGAQPAPPATRTTPAPTQTVPAPPTTAGVPPPATTTPPPAAAQPAPATTTEAPAEDDRSRAALVLLIVLGALVLLVAIIWAVATWQGLEPPWWPRVRHSLAELGWRASGAWSDFTDWVRLGR